MSCFNPNWRILACICPLSRYCPDFLKNTVPCRSVLIFRVSVLCAKKRCPLSVCLTGQGRVRAILNFGALVRRRLIWTFEVRFGSHVDVNHVSKF